MPNLSQDTRKPVRVELEVCHSTLARPCELRWNRLGCLLVVDILAGFLANGASVMLFTSPLIASASGSLAGLTASRNAAGPYFRARTVPVDPQSSLQVTLRTILGQLANRWVNTLNDSQRQGWADYAANVGLPARLGGSHFVSGNAQYIRSNTARRQAGLPRIDTAPIIFDVGDFTTLTAPGITAAGNLLAATFDNTDDWAGEDDSSLLVYGGIAVNPTINFFKGPYRFAARIDGDAITPPVSPFSVAGNYPYAAGQRGFFRVLVVRGDGRVSFDQKLDAIAA